MTYDAFTIPTPFGSFTVIADGDTVVGSGFTAGADELRDRLPDPGGEIRVRAELGEISSALDAYFTGADVTALDRLPVRMDGSPAISLNPWRPSRVWKSRNCAVRSSWHAGSMSRLPASVRKRKAATG